MKRALLSVLCVLLFILMLLQPQKVFCGAQKGLLLWFQTILPTLFPFLLVTNLLLHTNGFSYLTHIISPLICPIFRVSPAGSFAVITGFLCGYPLGAKVTADLLRQKVISDREAQYLLSFCNNTSPAFILNFLIWKTLKKPFFLMPTFAILFFTPILMSLIFRKYYKIPKAAYHTDRNAIPYTQKHRRLSQNCSMLDSCIMDGAEAIVKIGGYIILFSVISTLFSVTGMQHSFAGRLILSSLEITNGISLLGTLPVFQSYAALLALTSFGGVCSIAQTQCMLHETPLKILPYIIEKLATALAASFFAVLFIQFAKL